MGRFSEFFGKGMEGKGREGKGRKGSGREGKEREEKGREWKKREWKGREWMGRFSESVISVRNCLFIIHLKVIGKLYRQIQKGRQREQLPSN